MLRLNEVIEDVRQSVHSETDVDAVDAHVDSFHEQTDDAGLLGREQFVPEGIKPL